MNAQNQNHQHQETPKYMFNIAPCGTISPRVVTKGSAVLEIPPGVYTLTTDNEHGICLKPENNFELPKRIYGEVTNHTDRFLRAFELGNRNLAALLVGDPGSGKTLTLKTTAKKAVEIGMPFILVNEPFPPEVLVGFFSTIAQPVAVGFDEVDKTYAVQNQEGHTHASHLQRGLLMLLDGTYTGAKKLFIFTANDEDMISQYMKDRPSRVRYTIHFERITLSAVRDYVAYNLKDSTEAHIRAFVHMALCDGQKYGVAKSNGMNFDSMVEYVNEMNNFNVDLTDAMAWMSPKSKVSFSCFNVNVFQNDQLVHNVTGRGTHEGPYIEQDEFTLYVTVTEPNLEDPRALDFVTHKLTQEHFQGFGSELDTLEFKKGDITFICRYQRQHEINEMDNELRNKVETNNRKVKTGEDEPGAATQPSMQGFMGNPAPNHVLEYPNMARWHVDTQQQYARVGPNPEPAYKIRDAN